MLVEPTKTLTEDLRWNINAVLFDTKYRPTRHTSHENRVPTGKARFQVSTLLVTKCVECHLNGVEKA